ncbi:MAG: FAD-binding oxidoreductase, partial [Terriglobales bacterium]
MSAAAAAQSVEREIAAIVGEARVGPQELTSAQLEINGVSPALVVAPASAQEAAAVVRVAAERNLVVAPAGGFTKQDIGGVPERIDILLRTHRLNTVEAYDPGDLTVSVNAGMTFAEMQSKLAEHQQWLPYDAPKLSQATVGGLLATAPAGPLKHAFGGLRDFCIGVQFVTAEGKVAKGGGRVVKNVAGYDLMKLIIGSYGSLAIITQANFKVFPKPRQTQTFNCNFGSLAEAIQFRERIFKSPLTPICLEIISPHAPEYLNDPEPAQDPDHYVPSQPLRPTADVWQMALRAAGSDNVLARYRRDLGTAVARELH